jgi:hypothetical protein
MNPVTQSKNTRLLSVPIALALACFAVAAQVRATCQEGCDLINANTFLGDNALVNNTLGYHNTAIGTNALFGNTTGNRKRFRQCARQ